ncbi:MAG TPA: hypothetical protein VJM34_16035 [Novosphingobium sp.]|nr:hypothetical protein [Novosphingobium sp.]
MAEAINKADFVRHNPNENEAVDPFSRTEISRPDPVEEWDEDTWFEKINVALEKYGHLVRLLSEPCIDPLRIAVRHSLLQSYARDLGRLGITVGGHIGHA